MVHKLLDSEGLFSEHLLCARVEAGGLSVNSHYDSMSRLFIFSHSLGKIEA